MKESELQLLVQNRAPLDVVVQGTADGFEVTINKQMLGSARQAVRPFAKLDTVAKVLAAAGIKTFTVQL